MPSLDQARFLDSALRSVLDQQGPFELECIVVDGGSTDGSLAVLRSYGDRIRWMSGADTGQSDALNKGFALATGELRGWLNSDDLLAPGALARVAEVFAAEPETLWLYGKVAIVDEDDRSIRRFVTAYKNRRMRRYSFARLLTENWISQMGVFWRAEAQEQVGLFREDLHLAMDYDYWLRLARQSPGRFVDAYLAAFRWYPTTKTGSRSAEMLREELQVAREHACGAYRRELLLHSAYGARTRAVYAVLRLPHTLRRAKNGQGA